MNEKNGYLYKLNWDNEFGVRFNIKNNKSLTHIPRNIFAIELPEIYAGDIADEKIDKTLKIILRSTVDGSVEKEIFDILLRSGFDVDISLTNKNHVPWKYCGCVLDKISFTPLTDRKSRSNPFNFILYIKVEQIIYNGDNVVIEFGSVSDNCINQPTEEK
jgi:hypothetical protein